MRADRHSARRDEHVRREPALDHGAVALDLVGDGAEPLDDRAGRSQARREHDAVRLVDLPAAELAPRRPQLGARRHDRDAGTPRALHRLDATCCERRDARRSEQNAGRQAPRPGDDIAARSRTFSPETTDVASSIAWSRFHDALDRHDRVGSFRHDCSGRDPDRLARPEDCGGRPAGGGAIDDLRAARRVGARTANPSIAELGKGGRSTRARAASARKRPAAPRARRVRPATAPPGRAQVERFLDGQQAGHGPTLPASRTSPHGVPSRRDLGRHPRARRGAEHRSPLRRARGALASRSASPGRWCSSTTARRTAPSPRWRSCTKRTRTCASCGCAATSARRRRSTPASPRRAGTIIVTIDGDLQDDPAEIPRLLAKLDEGFDLVSGWKEKRRDPLTRRAPLEAVQLRSPAGSRACACTT